MPQPIKCNWCGYETEIRFQKGTKIKSVLCVKCGSIGTMTWNTEYLKRLRGGKNGKNEGTA